MIRRDWASLTWWRDRVGVAALGGGLVRQLPGDYAAFISQGWLVEDNSVAAAAQIARIRRAGVRCHPAAAWFRSIKTEPTRAAWFDRSATQVRLRNLARLLDACASAGADLSEFGLDLEACDWPGGVADRWPHPEELPVLRACLLPILDVLDAHGVRELWVHPAGPEYPSTQLLLAAFGQAVGADYWSYGWPRNQDPNSDAIYSGHLAKIAGLSLAVHAAACVYPRDIVQPGAVARLTRSGVDRMLWVLVGDESPAEIYGVASVP